MKLTENGSKSSFKVVEEGTYIGRCVRIIDVGTQVQEFEGNTKHVRQIILSFELPTEKITEGSFAGEPYMVSRFFTASLHEKAALRGCLEAWRGKKFTDEELQGFEIKAVLDKPCMLNVTHSKNGKAKISAIMALPKGQKAPNRINDLTYFSLETFDEEVFKGLSEGIQNIIRKSPEYEMATTTIDQVIPDAETTTEPF